MFVGLDFFSIDNYNENMNCCNKIYDLELSNSIIDEVDIRKDETLLFYDTKETWQPDTILLAKFQNDLEAGNIDNSGNPIVSLLFRRKKSTDLVWRDIATIPYSNQTKVYNLTDNFVKANQGYDYALVPVATGGVQGKYITESITPTFYGIFLLDSKNNFHLDKDLKWDNIVQNQTMGKYEPIGSSYPVMTFGSTNYKSGKITTTLFSDASLNEQGSGINGIDLLQERNLIDDLMVFVNNGQPKILKDGQGRFWCVVTANGIEIPNQAMLSLINSIQFDFIEIADTDSVSLQNLNLGNVIVNS